MSLAHFIYIPGVLLFGIVLGYIIGAKSAAIERSDGAAKKARAAERARARARD